MSAPTPDAGLGSFDEYRARLGSPAPVELHVEFGPRIPRAQLRQLCELLGHNPDLVVSVEVSAYRVRVEVIRSSTERPITHVVEHVVEP